MYVSKSLSMDNDMVNNDRQRGVNNMKTKLLVDSGVHETLLTEEKEERLQPERKSKGCHQNNFFSKS